LVSDRKQKLIGIFGEKNVSDEPAALESYSRDQSFATGMKPWFIVKAETEDQVQQVVKWANEEKVPLVPVSSGPPHFYGDTVPTATAAVIVDLTGMKRIMRIDRRNRIIAIEPGVTYPELQPKLAEHDLTLPHPLMPRPNKSVVASLLERQPTLIPKWQWGILDPLRSLGLVWGNGDKFMTGDAGSHGTLMEHWDRKLPPVNPSGPSQTDFYRFVVGAQGAMGIVTWATLKCAVLPRVRRMFFVPARRLEDLVNFTYRVLRVRFGDEIFVLNNAYLAGMLGKNAD
jgi:FAD/FMN-containing dehydrogenase